MDKKVTLHEKNNDGEILNQWMLLGVVISYILMMLLSLVNKFDTSAISVMFLSMIIMNRLFLLVKKRKFLSTGANILNLVIFLSALILLFANLDRVINYN